MKKIIALVLALVMTLSLGTVAFAERGNKYTAIDRVGEVAANLTARALQVPAMVTGIALDLNRGIITSRVEAAGTAAYYGAEIAANVLDFAVAVGSGVAQAKVNLTGGAAALALRGTANFLYEASGVNVRERFDEEAEKFNYEEVEAKLETNELKQQSDTAGNRTLYDLANELSDAARAVKAVTNYADSVIGFIPKAVDFTVDTVLNGKISNILDLATLPLQKNYTDAPKLFAQGDDQIATVELAGRTTTHSEDIGLKQSIVKSIMRPLFMIDRTVGGLTLKQLLVPGEWTKAEDNPGALVPRGIATDIISGHITEGVPMQEVTWNTFFSSVAGIADLDLDESDSYLAGLVNKTIAFVADEMKDASNFSEMNTRWTDGGDVAEFLFGMGYNLLHSNKWHGVAPSWEKKDMTPNDYSEGQLFEQDEMAESATQKVIQILPEASVEMNYANLEKFDHVAAAAK